MPFKSKKQERYLQINEPEIYQDWVEKYGRFSAESLCIVCNDKPVDKSHPNSMGVTCNTPKCVHYLHSAESFGAEAIPIRHSRRPNGYYAIKGYEDASEDGFIYRIYRAPDTNDWFKATVYDDNAMKDNFRKPTSRRLNPSGEMVISNDPPSLLIGAFPKLEDAKRALVFRMIQDGNYHQMITDGNLKWLLKDYYAESFSADNYEELITTCPYCEGVKIDDHDKYELVECFKRYLEDSTPHPDKRVMMLKKKAESFSADNYYSRNYRGFEIDKEGDERQAFYYITKGNNRIEMELNKSAERRRMRGDTYNYASYFYGNYPGRAEKMFETLDESLNWFDEQIEGGRVFKDWNAESFGAEDFERENETTEQMAVRAVNIVSLLKREYSIEDKHVEGLFDVLFGIARRHQTLKAESFGAEGGEPIYVVKRDYTGAETDYLIGTESYILKEMGVAIDVTAYELDIDYEDMSLEEIFDSVFEYGDEYDPELIGKFTDGMYLRLKSYDGDKDVGVLQMFDGGTIDYTFDLSRLGFKHESNAESFSAQEAFKPESNFVAIKELEKNWKENHSDATWDEMLSVEIGRLRNRLIMKGYDPDAKIGSPYYAESFNSYKVAPDLSSYTKAELVSSIAGPQGTAAYDEVVYDPLAQSRLSAESIDSFSPARLMILGASIGVALGLYKTRGE